MKQIRMALLAVAILGALSLSASEIIQAMKVPGNLGKIGVTSKAWLSAEYTDVMLYPQTTIVMNDQDANALNKGNLAKKVRIKALHDGHHIAFLVVWKDATHSVQEGISSGYGDGFAVQLATHVEDVKKLPYIGMGSEGRPVLVHLKKATGVTYEPNGYNDVYHQVNVSNQNLYEAKADAYQKEVVKKAITEYQRVFVSEGFGGMTQIKDGSAEAKMEMIYQGGLWRGVLVRALKDEYLSIFQGALPLSVAVWDGEKKNRDGIKHLSGWIPVKLVGTSGGEALIDELMVATNGNVKNGEKLVAENCAACHRYKGAEVAPEFMAPALYNIGGYATDAYLMESIVSPSAVVVPGFNKTAHKNYAWYNVGEKGERISTMPPYDWMDERSRQDIIAYLKTLKVGGEE